MLVIFRWRRDRWNVVEDVWLTKCQRLLSSWTFTTANSLTNFLSFTIGHYKDYTYKWELCCIQNLHFKVPCVQILIEDSCSDMISNYDEQIESMHSAKKRTYRGLRPVKRYITWVNCLKWNIWVEKVPIDRLISYINVFNSVIS